MMNSTAGTSVAYGFGRMGECGWSRSAWWYLFVWDGNWLVSCLGGVKGEKRGGKEKRMGEEGGKKDEQVIPNHPR